MLHTMLPTALPTATSVSSCMAAGSCAATPLPIAVSEVSSSGRVVPTAATVAPIKNSGTFAALAMRTALSTKRSPPFAIRTSPPPSTKINKKTAI